MKVLSWASFILVLIVASAMTSAGAADYDIILRHGMIYNGSGEPPSVGDVAMRKDAIAAVGNLKNRTAQKEIDASGLAVAPGFINMLSWANESLHRRWAFAKRHPPRRDARSHGRRRVDGAAERRDEEGDGRAAGRHQIRRSNGPRSANIWIIWRSAAFRRTWRRSSARRRCASMKSATRTGRRRRMSWSG